MHNKKRFEYEVESHTYLLHWYNSL